MLGSRLSLSIFSRVIRLILCLRNADILDGDEASALQYCAEPDPCATTAFADLIGQKCPCPPSG